MTDKEILIICALRYALGRRTYLTAAVANIVMDEIKSISNPALDIILSDIRSELDKIRVDDSKIDMPIWIDLKKFIENEQYMRLLQQKRRRE